MQIHQSIRNNHGSTGIRERFSALDVEALLNEIEVAEVSGFTSNTIRQWRYTGHGPEYIRLGRSVRYRVGTIREWLKAKAAA